MQGIALNSHPLRRIKWHEQIDRPHYLACIQHIQISARTTRYGIDMPQAFTLLPHCSPQPFRQMYRYTGEWPLAANTLTDRGGFPTMPQLQYIPVAGGQTGLPVTGLCPTYVRTAISARQITMYHCKYFPQRFPQTISAPSAKPLAPPLSPSVT